MARDGSIRRDDVLLASGFDDLVEVGMTRAAYDAGSRTSVYPPGGGHDWAYTGMFLVGSLVALLLWSITVPAPWWHRRRARSTSRPGQVNGSPRDEVITG